jgi:hypothetical protein
MKTLILGFGNPILTDDAVGIRIAEELAGEFPDMTVEASSEAGLAILEEVTLTGWISPPPLSWGKSWATPFPGR